MYFIKREFGIAGIVFSRIEGIRRKRRRAGEGGEDDEENENEDEDEDEVVDDEEEESPVCVSGLPSICRVDLTQERISTIMINNP